MLILCLSFSIALLDQVTKYLIAPRLAAGHITVIPGFFDLRYVQNTGAACGMFQGLNNWLVVLSFIMLLLIIFFRKSILQDTRIHRIAAGLLIGGIIGNLVDRIKSGYVVDYLDFYWRTHHFPAFNVADSAICIGVGLYILTQIFEARNAHGTTGDKPENAGK
jgi:signal peptidase II